MTGGIYLIQDGERLVEMREAAYDTELVLQDLLAKYPSLLAGEQVDPREPRRWMLVAQEMGVPREESGGDWWSVDHLFLDQDGIPTIVEVKRNTDTRIRREVVGQMLDYAANAIAYWPAERLRAIVEEGEAGKGAQRLADAFGPDVDPNGFWERVKTNLQAGRVRLVFVADLIPPELRRIVEFLNEQMDPAEVIALEVKQYTGEGLKTLVPRVVGQSAEAQQRKSGEKLPTKQWDEVSFFESLTKKASAGAVAAARRVLDWGRKNDLRIWWGRGAQDGSFIPIFDSAIGKQYTLSLWTYARAEILFQYQKERAPFDVPERRKELRNRLNEIAGVDIPEDGIERRPSLPLECFAIPEAQDRLIEILDWVLAEQRSASSKAESSNPG